MMRRRERGIENQERRERREKRRMGMIIKRMR
jgi:hypothetical protein